MTAASRLHGSQFARWKGQSGGFTRYKSVMRQLSLFAEVMQLMRLEHDNYADGFLERACLHHDSFFSPLFPKSEFLCLTIVV